MADRFQPQRTDADCYAVCIKNILDEYYSRILVPPSPHRVPVGKINKACGLQGTFQPTSLGLDMISEAMAPLTQDARIQPKWRDGADADWSRLQAVTGQPDASFPVVTLGSGYFDDAATPYRKRGVGSAWAHGVVVLGAADKVILFDPLAKRLFPENPDMYMLKMPRARFLNHWDTPVFRNEVFWFEPKEGDILGY